MAEFVSGSLDSVVFWDAKTFSKKRSAQPFRNSTSHLSSLTWNSTNTQLAVVPKHGERIALCEFHEDIMTWSYLVDMEGRSFTSGCLLHNSRYLASGSSDFTVNVWDLKNKTIFRTLLGHTSPVTGITRNHSDHWVVSGGQDGSVIMHAVDSSSTWQVLQSPSNQHNTGINRLCFSHVEKAQIGSVSEDGVVCVWSVESQRLLNKYTSPHAGPATDLCFSPSNNMLMISVGMDSKIKCYDIQTRKIVTEVSAPSPLSSVTMLKDGSTLLAGGVDGKLYVYELRTVKYPKTTLPGHKTAITCVMQQSQSTKHSSRSRGSKSYSSSKGKHNTDSPTPEKTMDGGEETSTHAGGFLKEVQFEEEGSGDRHSQKTHSSSSLKTESPNITPFVTQPPPRLAASTEVLSSLTQVTARGVPVFSVAATPASNQSHMSSIFSPLDPNLVTPVDTKMKVTRGTDVVPPTIQSTPSTTSTKPTSSTLPTTQASTKATSSTLPTTQASTKATSTKATSSTLPTTQASTKPTSSTLPTTQASTKPTSSTLPTTTYSNSMSVTTTTTTTTDASGIFSPLDNYAFHSRQPVASPLLISHTQPERRPHQDHTYQEPSLKTAASAGNYQLTSDLQDTDFPDGGTPDHLADLVKTKAVPTKTVALPSTQSHASSDSVERPSPLEEAVYQHSVPVDSMHSVGSTHSLFSSLPDLSGGSATSSSVDVSSLVDQTSTTLLTEQKHGPKTASAPPPNPIPPTNGIQMKYLENMIRDAHEETIQALHKDMRALSVENMKFFFALQQQSSAQHTALMEKIDHLRDELKFVQEMVHQYMPKH